MSRRFNHQIYPCKPRDTPKVFPLSLSTKYLPSCQQSWLLHNLSSQQNVVLKNSSPEFFWKHPKLFCLYISNQISLRGRFVFKRNVRISSITSFKDHCCSFSYELKATKMLNFIDLKKTPNFGHTMRTLWNTLYEILHKI